MRDVKRAPPKRGYLLTGATTATEAASVRVRDRGRYRHRYRQQPYTLYGRESNERADD